MKLSQKVAVITGGGSGIGRAAAILMAKEGAKVAIINRTLETGKKPSASWSMKEAAG